MAYTNNPKPRKPKASTKSMMAFMAKGPVLEALATDFHSHIAQRQRKNGCFCHGFANTLGIITYDPKVPTCT